jgi:hypothetical protein
LIAAKSSTCRDEVAALSRRKGSTSARVQRTAIVMTSELGDRVASAKVIVADHWGFTA